MKKIAKCEASKIIDSIPYIGDLKNKYCNKMYGEDSSLPYFNLLDLGIDDDEQYVDVDEVINRLTDWIYVEFPKCLDDGDTFMDKFQAIYNHYIFNVYIPRLEECAKDENDFKDVVITGEIKPYEDIYMCPNCCSWTHEFNEICPNCKSKNTLKDCEV